MDNFYIRKGVRPDIDVIKKIDHSIKTSYVWQMQQSDNNNAVETRFIQTQLPREMRINYPHSPESLELHWGEYSEILVGCMNQAPVGYLTIDSFFSPDTAWIKDIVVDELWRRNGIALKMVGAAVAWAKERHIDRLLIEVSSKNFPAISLAKKLKFKYSGFNDNYFRNQDIALFFTRDLRRRASG